MVGEWKRPESVPYPSIWSRFSGKRKINGKIPKFWIQDIPEDMFEKAIDVMCEYFVTEEPMNKVTHLANDKISVEDRRNLWRTLLTDKVGLICLMENHNPNDKPIVAGVNMTFISEKKLPPFDFKGKAVAKIFNAITYLIHLKDAFEIFGITEYLGAIGLSVLPQFRGQGIGEELLKARLLSKVKNSAIGLCVLPQFRGQGIAEELLKARTPLCKAVGIKATLTVFTAFPSQILAEKTGFKDLVAMSYDDLAKVNPEYKFPGISKLSKDIRYMYKLIE